MTSANNQPLFSPGAVYSFETHAPAILGAKIERARCTGELSYELAVESGFNVGEIYRDVYRKLPVGTPDTPLALRYYVFKTQSGARIIMCEQWVVKSTIELIEYLDIVVTLQRRTPGDLNKLSQLLRGGGFPEAVITTKNN